MARLSLVSLTKLSCGAFAALLLTAGSAAAQYNAQLLLPPGEFSQIAGTHADAISNAGDVVGEVLLSSSDVRPVLWTNGVGATLPIPAGYFWQFSLGAQFVNDVGTVVSWLRTSNDTNFEQRIVIWQNGSPQVLPPPDSRPCGRQFIRPYGFNNQGHVLLARVGEGCSDVWIWDGVIFRFVRDISDDVYGFSTADLIHSRLNDDDHIGIDQLPMSLPVCSGLGSIANILRGTLFAPIAGGTAIAINNRDQLLVYCLVGTENHLKLWDGVTLVDLGAAGQADLNDRGEVVFFAAGPLTPKIYRNGSVEDLVLPPVPNHVIDGGVLTNASGQIVLAELTGAVDQAVLFTPRTPVITWPTPQDIVYGTALGSTELNATANVQGTFSYTPAAGTVLHAGDAQTLSLTFTPSDLSTYDPTTASVTINVQPAPLAVSANSVGKVFGAPLPAFSAGYAGFVNGDGPGQLGGTLTLTTTATATSPVGPYAITPAGLASSDYTISFLPGTLTISPALTTTTAFALPSPVGYLQPIILIAVVSPVAPGAGVPDGVVQFKDGATVIGSAAASSGVAYIITSGLTPGVHTITAVYGGSSNFTGSGSGAAPLTVQPIANSTLTLLVPLTNPQAAGQPATFAALVIPLGGGTPPGNVQFTADGNPLGSAPVSPAGGGLFTAVVTTSALTTGLHTIGARYLGGGIFAASSALPQLQTIYSGAAPTPTTTMLTTAPGPSTLGQDVTFTATVTGGATSGDVNFYADTVLIGHAPIADNGGTFQAVLTVSTLPIGVHLVSASYVGSPGFAASNTLFAAQVVQP
jgi:hypothetical protein